MILARRERCGSCNPSGSRVSLMLGAPIYEVFFKPGPTACDKADQARYRVMGARSAVQAAYKDLADDENSFGPFAFRPNLAKMAEARDSMKRVFERRKRSWERKRERRLKPTRNSNKTL
jgi:hypothetical protein